MAFIHLFLPPQEGASTETETGWAELPCVHVVLQRPRGSSGHEGVMSLCRRSSIKWQSNSLCFVTALLSFNMCPEQQKSAGFISLGHKSSKEFSCWIATKVNALQKSLCKESILSWSYLIRLKRVWFLAAQNHQKTKAVRFIFCYIKSNFKCQVL